MSYAPGEDPSLSRNWAKQLRDQLTVFSRLGPIFVLVSKILIWKTLLVKTSCTYGCAARYDRSEDVALHSNTQGKWDNIQ